eukprot:9476365-Pyramimonas_sp.AAC.1
MPGSGHQHRANNTNAERVQSSRDGQSSTGISMLEPKKGGSLSMHYVALKRSNSTVARKVSEPQAAERPR